MNLKTINLVFLICVILSPVVIHTISSFSEEKTIVLTFEETEEEQNEDKDSKEELEEKSLDYIHAVSRKTTFLKENSFVRYCIHENVLIRAIEIFLQPPEFK